MAIDLSFLLLLGLGLGLGGTLGALMLTRVRRQRLARRRVVERPNSHHIPVPPPETMARRRWHGMALDRIHEINRVEVLRLLAKVEAVGPDALSDRERTFLDTMVELAGE